MNEWISADERLPEPSGYAVNVQTGERLPSTVSDDVLVYFPHGDCAIEQANYDHETHEWSLVGHGFTAPDCDPTHWMPLPDPPKVKP